MSKRLHREDTTNRQSTGESHNRISIKLGHANVTMNLATAEYLKAKLDQAEVIERQAQAGRIAARRINKEVA